MAPPPKSKWLDYLAPTLDSSTDTSGTNPSSVKKSTSSESPFLLTPRLKQIDPVRDRGSADLEKPFDPKTFLKSVPRQKSVGADQIDGMHPEFANRFALFSKDMQKLFPSYQISAGYDSTGRKHMPNSWHYVGQAADVVPDWNFKKTPENMAKITNLANKYGLTLFDEWDETNSSHFHMMIPNKLPKGMTPELMSDGRKRNQSQLEDFVKAYAARNNVDPDVAVKMLRHETNYEKDHVGQDARYGMGRLSKAEITAVLQNKYPNMTIKDYMEMPNLQVQVFVDHMNGLFDKAVGGYGNTAKGILAFKAGREKADEAEKTGLLSNPDTKKYISRILGIPEDKVEEAVLTGKGAEYDIAAIRQKAIDQKINLFGTPIIGVNSSTLGLSVVPPDPSFSFMDRAALTGKQMLRNAGEMVVDLANQAGAYGVGGKVMDLLGGATGLFPVPFAEQSAQRLFPVLSLPEALKPDGTVDDKHWAVSTVRSSINNAFFHVPGAVFSNMRPSMDYAEWKDKLNTSSYALLTGTDFLMSLPTLTMAAEVAIPKAASAAISSAVGVFPRLSQLTGANMITKALYETSASLSEKALLATAEKSSVKAGALSLAARFLLPSPKIFSNAISYSVLAGTEGMAHEYQNQLEKGADKEQAVSAAYAAGMQMASVVGTMTMILPFAHMAGPLVAACAKKGSAGVIAACEAGAFGAEGVQAAKILKTQWIEWPEQIKAVAAKEAYMAFKALGKVEQTGIAGMVEAAPKRLALLHSAAINESTQLDLIETLNSTRMKTQAAADFYKSSLGLADKEVGTIQNQVKFAEDSMEKLSQDPTVSQYLTKEAQLRSLNELRSKGVDQAGQALVDPKTGKATLAAQSIDKRIATLQKEMTDALSAKPIVPTGPSSLESAFAEVQELQKALNPANTADDGLLKKLSDAQYQQHAQVPGADALVKKAQDAIADAKNRIFDLERKHPAVKNYLNLQSQVDVLLRQQANNKNLLGQALSDGKGKLTPEGKYVSRQIKQLQSKMVQETAASMSVPQDPAAAIKEFLQHRYRLTGSTADNGPADMLQLALNPNANPSQVGLRAQLEAAKSQPFFKNADKYKQALNETDFAQRCIDAAEKEARQALLDGRVPDYESAVLITPLPSDMVGNEKRMLPMLRQALSDRVKAASDFSENAPYAPLLDRELMMEVERTLVATKAVTLTTEKQVGTLDSAIENLKGLLSRATSGKGQIKKILEDAEEHRSRIVGIPAETAEESATGVARPGVKGAAAYAPEALVQPLVRKVPGAEYGPNGVPMEKGVTTADFIRRALDVRTEEFPMGIPISSFAEKGFQYAIDNPVEAKITGEALYRIGSTLISENSAKSMEGARALMDMMATGKIAADPEVQAFNAMKQFMNLTTQESRSLDSVIKASAVDLSNAAETASLSLYLYDYAQSGVKASKRLADDLEQSMHNEFLRILDIGGKKKPQRVPEQISFELVDAIESRDPQKLAQVLSQNKKVMIDGKEQMVDYSKFVQPMKKYFDVMTTLERFTIKEDSLGAKFTAGYFMHNYPRLVSFLRKGMEHAKVMSGTAPFEKTRTVDSIKSARYLSQAAEAEIEALSGGKIKNWKDFVYIKNRKGMTEMQTRAEMLNVTEEKAQQLMHDVLLGDAVTDISQVLANTVHTRIRVSQVRQILDCMRRINGDTGYPLLADSRKLSKDVLTSIESVQGDVKRNMFSRAVREPYVRLNTMPGFAAYPDSEHMLMHPQSAHMFRQFVLAGRGEDPGLMGSMSKMMIWLRNLSLMGPPGQYLTGLMSNYSTLTNFNLAKAYGLIPMGQKALQGPDFLYRSLKAGVIPQSFMRNMVTPVEDLMSDAKKVPELADALRDKFGVGTPFSKLMEKTEGKLDLSRYNPITMIEDVDRFINQHAMFNILSQAQVGAWIHYTGQIMDKAGPELIEKFGGYGPALFVAERQAAQHVNRLGGIIAPHMMDKGLREQIWRWTQAPGFFAAKWDTMVAALDTTLTLIGKDNLIRSRFAWSPTKSMEANLALNRRAELGRFIVGGMITDVLYRNMLSKAVSYYHGTTMAALPGKEYSIQFDNNTYMSTPFLGMLRPIMKMVSEAKDGNVRKAFDVFSGHMHPILRWAVEGGVSRGPEASKLPMNAMSGAFWSQLGTEGARRVFNTEAVGYREGWAPPGEGLFGTEYGIPMSNRDWAFSWLTGFQLSKSQPMQVMEARAIANQMENPKVRMSETLKDYGVLYNDVYTNPERRNKILDAAIEFAMHKGTPIADPRLREIYKQYHPDGNYVVLNRNQVLETIKEAFYPADREYNKLGEKEYGMVNKQLREELARRIDERLVSQAKSKAVADNIEKRIPLNSTMSKVSEFLFGPTYPLETDASRVLPLSGK